MTDKSEQTSDNQKRVPIGLDFSAEAYRRLEEIKARTDAKTDGQFIRDAIRVYEWFLLKRDEGYTVVIAKNGEGKEIKFFFDEAPPSSPSAADGT